MNRSAFLRTLVRGVALVGLFSLLGAPTCDQPFGPTATGSGTNHIYNAFGDSIAAGYKDGTFPGQIKSYVGYYADLAAADRAWKVTYQGFTTSGETTPQIRSRMLNNVSQLRESDMFSWDAGGNDFLGARSDYYSSCNVGALDNALDVWRGDWDDLVDVVESNVGTTANFATVIRTMNTYYPDPDNDRARSCSGIGTHFRVFLPRLLAAGDYACRSAEARGWRCADTFAVMNCDQDANNNPDARCPNKRYVQELVESGICPRNRTSSAYRDASVDPACIAAHLDATGDWDWFYDPSYIIRNGTVYNLIQGDDTHPNAEGHRQIGRAHHELGYDDVEGALYEDTYQLCIDGQDNDGDGVADCGDGNCAVYCQ